MKTNVLIITIHLVCLSIFCGCLRHRSFEFDDPRFLKSNTQEYDYKRSITGLDLSLYCAILNVTTLKLQVRFTNNSKYTMKYTPSKLSLSHNTTLLDRINIYVDGKPADESVVLTLPSGESRTVTWRYIWPHGEHPSNPTAELSFGSVRTTGGSESEIRLGETTMTLRRE